mmetsp:Transcript_41378/g.79127  ORF Transcript_41378/g.79127 Transcript_41378/m.79127 type:complete len:260 (+) Transcript_41378:383-1162(+)
MKQYLFLHHVRRHRVGVPPYTPIIHKLRRSRRVHHPVRVLDKTLRVNAQTFRGHLLHHSLAEQRRVQRARLLHLELGVDRHGGGGLADLDNLRGDLVQHRLYGASVRRRPEPAGYGGVIREPNCAHQPVPRRVAGGADVEPVAQVDAPLARRVPHRPRVLHQLKRARAAHAALLKGPQPARSGKRRKHSVPGGEQAVRAERDARRQRLVLIVVYAGVVGQPEVVRLRSALPLVRPAVRPATPSRLTRYHRLVFGDNFAV